MQRKIASWVAAATFLVVLARTASGAESFESFAENFSSNPFDRGWSVFGDTNLFRWDSQAGQLDVTWDSSRTNSFFSLPLGALLNRHDSFSVSLDLLVSDYAGGVTPGENGAMQIAFGFQHQADAQRDNFYRGAVSNVPNLVEFNFFPDTGFGPSIWPAVLSTNSVLNYSGPSDITIAPLPMGVTMRVTLDYNATNQAATITILTNGVLAAPITTAPLSTNSSAFSSPFTDFVVDTFSVSSYGDAGQDPQYAGSLLAHGTIDNVVITIAPNPIRKFAGGVTDARWTGTLLSRTGWEYQLQATYDFALWADVGEPMAGSGEHIQLIDPAPSGDRKFYRVSAQPTKQERP